MPSFHPARVLRAAVAAAAALSALLLVPVPAAHAAPAPRTVAGGRLDWGVKSSFQSYVTGPIAQGSWSLTGGAGTVGSEQYRFPSARGSYDQATGALTAGFQGGVHFLGHRTADGGHQLDLTISRPSVRLSGHSGTLYADMSSKDKSSGRVTTSAQVPLAQLSLGGVSTRGVTGPQLALSGVPATLTAQGARAFAGYYAAGAPLDPVSLSVDLRAAPKAAPATAKPVSPTTAPPSTAAAAPTSGVQKSGAREAGSGAVLDGAADWGVRRTFREYVTGDIAKGHWTVADGARDGGALFRFGAGRGTYDAAAHSLKATFAGSLRFLGLRAADGRYGLDLTISSVRVEVAAGKGTLYANGSPLVTFPAPAGLAPRDGLISLSEAPTTLTAQGARRFDGSYAAGTSMDPLTVSVALDTTAVLPALPDIGSDPTTAPASRPTTSPAPTPAAADAADSRPAERTSAAASAGDGVPAGVLIGGAAAVLAAAGVTAAIVRRRRHASDG